MDYKNEDNEDKKYKKSYGRKEFKKDVAEAVKPELEKFKKKNLNHLFPNLPTARVCTQAGALVNCASI